MHCLKVILISFIIYGVKILYYKSSTDYFFDAYPEDYKKAFNTTSKESFHYEMTYFLFGEWYSLKT